jgi:putative nucleotidyltransferase-like protein
MDGRREGAAGGGTRGDWGALVPAGQWAVYERAIVQARAAGIPFAVGGAFALASWTGSFRDTKDFDLFVLPRDREAMIAALGRAGLRDYYERLPYDRAWIYRGVDGEVIVDVIWAMANQRAAVDAEWLARAATVETRGQALPVLAAEELLWAKLYIVQRERCDWPDVLNLIHARGPALDWDHLRRRLGEDLPLLQGALAVYAWLCPERAGDLPAGLWRDVGLSPPGAEPAPGGRRRVDLLDSRPWLYPPAEETDAAAAGTAGERTC